MDPAQFWAHSIDLHYWKRRGGFLEKSTRRVRAHYALNSQMRSEAHTALTASLVLHHTRIYKCAMKKFGFNGQMRKEPFFIVIYHSSLVKGAMNAARVCKLRNGV
jgi:hypothetical protein